MESMRQKEQDWKLWIDTGGTFTDCMAIDPGGNYHAAKVLSSSSLRGKLLSRAASAQGFAVEQDWEAPDDFITGFEFRLLGSNGETARVTSFDSDSSIISLDRSIEVSEFPISFEVRSDEEAPVLAARLVTGTAAEANLPSISMRLATTKATNALLEEEGADTALFVTEGFGDLLKIGTQQRPDLFALKVEKTEPLYAEVAEVPERLDSEGNPLKALDCSGLEREVEEMVASGITSAAVSLMHAYKNNLHEEELKKWLREKGFEHVSISSGLSPFIGVIARTETTLVNAYLAPIIDQYLDDVQSAVSESSIYVMSSAGGLSTREKYTPKDSLLSGPAGGVVGAAAVGDEEGLHNVISLDMGGTSTDVARYDSDFDYVFEHSIGRAHLFAPALNIETVAAGGGSICYFDGYKLCVGPQSAGARPGPACYGAGGPLTITDVNLLLGRLDPANFHIPVDMQAAEDELRAVIDSIKDAGRQVESREQVLSGFLRIANERMADAIRKISIRKGYDTRDYAMVGFGGAGGQHVCAIAGRLNIDTVLIPEDAGLLSAYGLGRAQVEEFAEQQVLKPLDEMEHSLNGMCDELAERAKDKLKREVEQGREVAIERILVSMRLQGQETSLEIEYGEGVDPKSAFKERYRKRYGHWIADRNIEVESVRVVVATKTEFSTPERPYSSKKKPEPLFRKPAWFDGKRQQISVYRREDLAPGQVFSGPALILDPHSTVVVEPGWEVNISKRKALKLRLLEQSRDETEEAESEVARLELFTNRFTTIAEEMGEMLRRTALSVNVKDRLDFSCALLNSDGELVVNAPHIPVHLGALGLCVRKLKEHIAMEEGDLVITNHPAFGGSHLPDITLVAPVYVEGDLLGYAASRAHHAEIGGIAPGSMPPDATRLSEEGVVIPPMHLVRKGEERWSQIRKHLREAQYPSRNVEENIADLQAAVAANRRGLEGLRNLCSIHGKEEVRHYMNALKKHAEEKMRNTIRNIPSGRYESMEYLDDGSPLAVSLEISDENIRIDFDGTAGVHPKNLNATPAIVNSVVMYVMRLLIDEPIPLNEGILAPVQMNIPSSLLNPDFDADPARCPAVVGGNVEVSQRLVDTLLKPFDRLACSQGTMNNVLFGNDNFGYYETVGGGTGGGPDFDGADAVHHHMTNTRGTDPEILEHRYPVRLETYAIREGSGGGGRNRGGDGIYREMTFLQDVQLSVLTQHRKQQPYGIKGGEPALAGEQLVVRADGSRERLEEIDGRKLQKGDTFILKTPGGGGYGEK